MFSINENKTNQTENSIEYWKSKFPQCFEKTLRIQLNRIEVKSNKKESGVTNEKMNSKSSKRTTRNSRKQNFDVDWVRISNGIYKGDIAKLESLNECQSEARLKVFPRINYDSFVVDEVLTTQRTKRRPPLKAFDPSAIRYDKMQINL